MSRRHLTTAITMVVLLAILVVGLVVGAKSFFAPVQAPDASKDQVGCTTKTIHAGKRIRSSQVQVSVFNAGDRSGLADHTLAALERRGFKAGKAGNAPSDVKVKRVQVWSTERKDPEAALVARQFGRRLKVTFADTDLGPGVDVVVGNGYSGLVRAKKSIKARTAQEICVPSPNAG